METCIICKTKKASKYFPSQIVKGKRYYKKYCNSCRNKKFPPKYTTRKEINARYKLSYRSKQLQVKLDIMRIIDAPRCRVCGFDDVRALSFHHKDPSQKSFGISEAFTHNYSFETILEEAKKCEVLCLNHQAIEHSTLSIENLQ